MKPQSRPRRTCETAAEMGRPEAVLPRGRGGGAPVARLQAGTGGGNGARGRGYFRESAGDQADAAVAVAAARSAALTDTATGLAATVADWGRPRSLRRRWSLPRRQLEPGPSGGKVPRGTCRHWSCSPLPPLRQSVQNYSSIFCLLFAMLLPC